MSSVFPQPLGDSTSVPDWAIAVITASVVTTFLWIFAVIILKRSKKFEGSQKTKTDFSSVVYTNKGHEHVTRSASPPPPISAPSHQNTSTKFVKDEKEFILSLADQSSDDKTSLKSHASSISDDQEIKGKGVPVVSQSVRTDSAAAEITDITSLDGSEASSQESPLAGMVLSRPVTVRQLGATIREPGYIETEFRKLPTLIISMESMPPGTERKNRYTNVLPTPRTRVQLPQVFGHPNSDYINANYIRGYKGTACQYIATQGPLESTVEDFWRMIIDNNTSIIVMVTNFQERGIDKCTRYWPGQGSEEYGSVQVTLLQQTAHGTYNSSTLQVCGPDGVAKTIVHYRLTCWPQQGVPKDTKIITDFLRSIKMTDSAGPAVVHCSAGIGRTGVLIACDIGIQGILQGDPKIDILRIVSTLRQDRSGMVQTREQYRFIHQALYSAAKEERAK